MEITYTKQGDYLLPDLKLKEKKNVKLGRYAKLRLKFIKQEMKSFYTKLLMEDRLEEYLSKMNSYAESLQAKFATGHELEEKIIKHIGEMQYV